MGSKVLVVDDDPVCRQLLSMLLRAQGLEVSLAVNGQDAVAEFARIQPDLVLLDVDMPLMNGMEVCRQLKSNPATRLTPVVLVTGLNATEDRIRGIEAGADDFITKPFDNNELLARARSLLNLKAYTDELERAESVVFTLARSIEGKDPYTEGHCQRLAEYSARLGAAMGLPEEEVTALRRAGVVHDVGKVAVPDAVLLKPGILTPAERTVMEQHPLVGERICAPLRSFRLVLPIIRHHHERFDGSGYPDGLAGEQIPLTARILQTVDIFDALTTARPYKPALARAEALAMMAEEAEKGWRDPSVLHVFEKVMNGWGGHGQTPINADQHNPRRTQMSRGRTGRGEELTIDDCGAKGRRRG